MTGRLTWLLVAAFLAGCAHPDPPLLTLSGRVCDAAPSLGTTIDVPFDSIGGAKAEFGPASPCLQAGGGRDVTYAVFRLPNAPAPYQVTVSSEVVGTAVVAPQARVYGNDGTVVRTISAPEFRQTLSGYTAGLRTQGTERLLLVTADPATVGQPVLLRLGARDVGTQVAAAVVVPVIILAVPVEGQLRERGATLSLNGLVRVSAMPIRTVP